MPRVTEKYIQRRRAEILKGAWKCFARDGFHAATMDEIIAEAGISPSVMYRWFRSKSELVEAAAAEVLQGLIDALDNLLTIDPPLSLDQAIEEILHSNVDRPSLEGVNLPALAVQVWAESLRNPAIHELLADRYQKLSDGLAELVRRHQRAGTLPAEIDPEDAARQLFSMLPGFILQQLTLESPQGPHVFARSAGSLFGAIPLDMSDR